MRRIEERPIPPRHWSQRPVNPSLSASPTLSSQTHRPYTKPTNIKSITDALPHKDTLTLSINRDTLTHQTGFPCVHFSSVAAVHTGRRAVNGSKCRAKAAIPASFSFRRAQSLGEKVGGTRHFLVLNSVNFPTFALSRRESPLSSLRRLFSHPQNRGRELF